MKRFIAVLSGLLLAACVMGTPAFSADQTIAMSTTTSTQASGLLDVLLPEFTADTGIQVKVIAKGTGAAIRDGQDGNVDVIFVHAKAREEKFVSEGWGTKRYAVMHNDFVILGPSADPAGIKGETDAAKALKKIAESGSLFVSRGDDSGTHTKEQALWKLTGLPLIEHTSPITSGSQTRQIRFIQPDGKWYMSIGQGMGKTLTFADEKRAYALADRGTYIKYKLGRKEGLDLEVLSEGDASLQNLYGVIPVNPAKYPHVKYEAAEKFAQWLVSPRGQKLIADYKLLGQQLFYPDAISR
ncbi:MAG: substrate-binding domain-containing protein [Desulfobacterales bacterium]|nr:substrate-binding domain-containing protein [Desulfobacterales bacterium]